MVDLDLFNAKVVDFDGLTLCLPNGKVFGEMIVNMSQSGPRALIAIAAVLASKSVPDAEPEVPDDILPASTCLRLSTARVGDQQIDSAFRLQQLEALRPRGCFEGPIAQLFQYQRSGRAPRPHALRPLRSPPLRLASRGGQSATR